MSTAYFYSGTDYSIGGGTFRYYFNPVGDVLGATVDDVRFRFFIDYNNGASVDLGKVDIWLRAPDGDQDKIYSNADGLWRDDTDDGNDSDGGNDHDISFWGTDNISKSSYGWDDLDNADVNGTWQLIVENNTGKWLDLSFLEVWVDYDKPVDYTVTDIQIIGTQQVGQPVLIQSTIQNIGDKYKLETVKIEYLVEGQVIGSSTLLAGLLPGATNVETELHDFDKIGANEVEVRIVTGSDPDKSNNSRTETFIFEHNQPDLEVTDIRITGDGVAGGTHWITADVTNVGNANHYGDVLLNFLVNDEVIGTQTIGLGGLNVMLPGTTNSETELHFIGDAGDVDIAVEIVNPSSSDYDDTNDALEETFFFATPLFAPDLTVTDVRVQGGWFQGDEVELSVYVENIGSDLWNLLSGAPQIEYFVRYEGETSWDSVGTDELTLGLLPFTGNWEDTTFTLAQDGAFEVKVEVSGNDYELDDKNNSWTEEAAHSRDTAPQKTLENSADDVNLAMLMARTVYGDIDIPEAYRGTVRNGLDDNYIGYLDNFGFDVLTAADFGGDFRSVDHLSTFYSGGLFVGDQGLAVPLPEFWQAQGLVAVGTDATGAKTMTLTFRGTDSVDLVESVLGQAWTGDGLYDYYESMRPLIDAALAYANDASNGIEKMIVSGHSLGGAATDAFAYVDAHRLNSDVDLTVVSFASAGLDRNFLEDSPFFKGMQGQYDETQNPFTTSVPGHLLSLKAPSYYIGVSHAIDAVTYPFENPLYVGVQGLENKIPNQPLLTNWNPHAAIVDIETPNMSNYDMPGFNFGAGHNSGHYWANVSQVMTDDLMEHYSGHRIIAGLSDYARIEDYDGSIFSVFEEYNYHDNGTNDDNDDDKGGKALRGAEGADFILGFSGNDELFGNGGHDLLSGGEGDDTLNGGAGDDHVDGGDGDDVLGGSGGNDTILGGEGADRAEGEAGADLLNGGAGADSLFGGIGDDTILGEAGNDRVFGGADNDEIDGGEGNDSLEGSGGDDSILGGTGLDTLVGGSGDDTVDGGAGDDVLRTGAGNDSLLGSEGDDLMFASSGDDVMIGGAGNDTLVGEGDADDMDGGTGNDVLRAGDGNDTVLGGEGDDMAFGGNGNDELVGGLGADTVEGNGGNDLISGEDGSDLLAGGTGMDSLFGGQGDDTLRGEAGDDSLSADTGNDIVFGGSGADDIKGGAGNDTLEGDQQNDTLSGDAGDDILRGGDGYDSLDGGADNDSLVGGNGEDVLTGGLGADTLRGNAQDDTFIFNTVAESSGTGVDTIADMEGVGSAGGDVIDLNSIDADLLALGDQAFTFLGEQTTASGLAFGAGALWVENSATQTLLLGLVDNDAVVDLTLLINDGAAVLAADYTVSEFIL